ILMSTIFFMVLSYYLSKEKNLKEYYIISVILNVIIFLTCFFLKDGFLINTVHKMFPFLND
ncbi:MAG: hypothetical protein KA174_11785, partial [Chitinophagales bacterium]|nr:hypothetical protein [Chitinophagales bacterium]